MTRKTRLLAFPVLAAILAAAPVVSTAPALPSDDAAITHALARLTFGARPGDVERVRAIGLATWIDRQLHPERIDDAAAERRLPAAPERPASFDDRRAAMRYTRESVQHLQAARIVRATYSERQLEELLTDFWFNHFNVFARKGRTGLFIAEYERDAIRPHLLGRFRDLLGATAKSPAMLMYLDNWQSVDPEGAARVAAVARVRPQAPAPEAQPPQPPRRGGLNENYARELLELHTLGVDGGYTQDDVVAVARAFTGWTIGRPNRPDGGRFRFARPLHDRGEKVVLGRRLPGGRGIEDGEDVLDLLARHPSTARHIATKLARRFVSDTPPEALVARAATRFRDTDGDLREVIRLIITSEEFFSAEARGAKIKTPLEFVVSALRATGRDLRQPRAAARAVQELGMPLYLCSPPTGYADTADAWISPGALIARMSVARTIAPGRAEEIGGPDFQKR